MPLEALPLNLLAFSATAEGNILALGHDSWTPVRAQASMLLDLLRPETRLAPVV
jgi:hypothetical protein